MSQRQKSVCGASSPARKNAAHATRVNVATRANHNARHISVYVESAVLKNIASPSSDEEGGGYEIALTDALVQEDMLSPMQFETMERASRSLCLYGAFMLCDGTGIGKGRSIAAVAVEFLARHPEGRVAWFSINKSLQAVARRDVAAMGRFGCDVRWGENVRYFSYPMLRCDKTFADVCDFLRTPQALVLLDECHWLRRKSPATCRVTAAMASAPSARIMFVSATPASCASHVHYLARLSPVIANGTAESLARKCGNIILELLTIQLKSEGRLLSRKLSQDGVQVETLHVALTPDQRALYDACCSALNRGDGSGSHAPCHQLFYRNLITSFKVGVILDRVNLEMQRGHAVVLCVQSTGAACAQRNGDATTSMCQDYAGRHLQADALATLAFSGNLADVLQDRLGRGVVADLTGRSSHRERRQAIAAFQSGRKRVALLSRAGSTGISLHNACPQAQKRVFLIVELPWTSEAFVQQCGRVHRAQGRHAPRYVIVRTDVPAELRFFTSLQQRLRSMSAVTCADHEGDDGDVGAVLKRTYTSVCVQCRRLVVLEILYRHHRARLAGSAPETPTSPTPSLETGPNVARNILAMYANSPATRTPAPHGTHRDALECRRDAQLLADCNTCLPQCRLWNATAWSPAIHRFASPRFRAAVRALLLVWRRGQEGNCLARLPEAILLVIVDMMCDDVHDASAARVHDAVVRRGFGPLDMLGMGTGGLYNMMLGLPIASQHALDRMVATHALDRAPPTTRRVFSDVVRDSLPAGFSFHNVTRRDAVDGTIRIGVTVHAPRLPRVEAAVSYNGTLHGVVFDGSGGAVLHSADIAHEDVLLRPTQITGLRAAGAFVLSDASDVTRLLKNKARRLARRAVKNSGEYVIATRRHVELFETSKRLIVTHDNSSRSDSDPWGESFTGLLIDQPA